MAKKTTNQTGARTRSIRLRAGFEGLLQLLATRDAMDVSELVNMAIRKMLEERGLWPVLSTEWLEFERQLAEQSRQRPKSK